MKKVAVILSIFCVVLAVLIFTFVGKEKGDSVAPINPSSVEEVKVPVDEVVNSSAPLVPDVEKVEKVITNEIIKEISSVKTISESSLSSPSDVKEVITVISNKRIILLDESVDSTSNKMLTYCFDVLTPDNTELVLFVTKNVYSEYLVGDKLSVSYLTYTNDVGVIFPIVLAVNAL